MAESPVLTDEDIKTSWTRAGGDKPDYELKTDPDGTDGDATDADGTDADGTDTGGTDADGTDSDAQDA